ncbi:MAG TPA: hypothetical protein VIK27_12715 [Candidatus Aquilonibacter sp.]
MLLALMLALLAPLHAAPIMPTDATPSPQVYRTLIRGRFEAFGYSGVMRLHFSDDGYVNGTYRPDSGGGIGTVRGGHQGKRIWLDIATLGGIHVEATLDHGVIKGVAAPLGPQATQYVFTATPQPSP